MHGYQVSAGYAHSIYLICIKKLNMHCGICTMDNNTEYSLVRRDDKDGCYGYSPHYGWNKLSHDILIQLSKRQGKRGKSK